MANAEFIENLKSFGLTGQESVIYTALVEHGAMTGYEVAKETGISRSNVYSSLAGLVDKGAAYVCEGETAKYISEDIKIFTESTIAELKKKAEDLEKNAPKQAVKNAEYITISGAKRIRNKIGSMLDKCRLRVYVMAETTILETFRPQLEACISQGRKVVVLSEGFEIEGAYLYHTVPEAGQIRLITDSSEVFTGTFEGKESDTCLYSTQQNLVAVMKEALGNKISLIENMEEKQ